MFGTTSGTRSTFFSFVVKWNSNGTGIKTVTSTGPFLHWNLQFQWKLHLCPAAPAVHPDGEPGDGAGLQHWLHSLVRPLPQHQSPT